MTLEQILDCSAEQLKAVSDAELLKHFEKYLCVTRPELAQRPTQQKTFVEQIIDPKKKAALAALAAEGIDLSFLKKKQYRK